MMGAGVRVGGATGAAAGSSVDHVSLLSVEEALRAQGYDLMASPAKKALYTRLYNCFSHDFALICEQSEKINPLLKKFFDYFSENLVNTSGAVAYFDTLLAAAPKMPEPAEDIAFFASNMGAEVLDAFQPEATDIFSTNYKAMMSLTAGSLQQCIQARQLTGGIEQRHHKKLFLSMCGLFHDAIFLRDRGHDELHSAALQQQAFADFSATLDADERALWNALRDVVIVGGTLPCIIRKTDTHEMIQKSLFELVDIISPANYKEMPAGLAEIFRFLRMIADVDVQRSLMPTILDVFPSFAADSGTGAGLMLRLSVVLTASVLTEAAHKHVTQESALKEIRIKLGQSMRMLSELVMGDDLKSPELIQLKIAHFIHAKDTSGIELTAEDITALVAKIEGEDFFAHMNENGLKSAHEAGVTAFSTPGGAELEARSVPFVQESWGWHVKLFSEIKRFLQSATLEEANALLKDILNEAKLQQGGSLDAARLCAQVLEPGMSHDAEVSQARHSSVFRGRRGSMVPPPAAPMDSPAAAVVARAPFAPPSVPVDDVQVGGEVAVAPGRSLVNRLCPCLWFVDHHHATVRIPTDTSQAIAAPVQASMQ